MMAQRDNAAMNALEDGVMALDDTFRFHCKMCGKCCIDREDILLNPKDLYRIAQAMGKPPIEVYREHCESYLGHTSGMVIVRLKPVGDEKRCPLLYNGRCSVHQSKPTVCALFPLGRVILTPDGVTDFSNIEPGYILQKVSCGDRSEKHTVREWLENFGVSAEDRFFPLWSHTVMDYGRLVKHLQEIVSPDTVQLLYASILGGIYLNYDIGNPFLPQFERNDDAFRTMMKRIGTGRVGE